MTKIKICGITNIEDAQLAVEAGANLLGFIFYEPSPRYITPQTVLEIVSHFKGQTTNHKLPLFVGVFVNTPLSDIEYILDFCRLDAVQLYGEESPEFVAHFQNQAYKALRPKSNEETEHLVKLYTQSHQIREGTSHLPSLLLDAYHPKLYGGTGRFTDWQMAAKVAKQHPLMLAGSLTSENVGAAIETIKPWGVDVSSGVEAKKGKKDPDKVKAFIREARKTTA